jgi:heptose I phosphotransferase
VVRLELDDASGRAAALYLKREWNPKAAMVVRRWLAAGLRAPPSRSRREWTTLRSLASRGVSVAEPVAMGEERRGGFFKRGLLLVREVPEAVNLAEYLAESAPGPAATPEAARGRHALARELGAMVRRMHDSGMAYRDLYAKHIFVRRSPDPAGSFAPTLIDAQRAHRFPHLSPQHRWRDLAALETTLRDTPATRTDRLRFVLSYARQSGLTPATRELMARVSSRSDRLGGRGRDPRRFQSRREPPVGMRPLEGENWRHVDNHRIVAIERFLPVLRSLGLATVRDVMAYRGGTSYRNVPDRLTVRVPFTWPDGGGQSALYLKRHRRVDGRAWIEGLAFWRKPLTRAEAEFRSLFQLVHCGVATAQPVAWGQEHRWSVRQDSFLITEEIPGGEPADDYLRRRFPPGGGGEASLKRELVARIAELARRMHGHGFCHRDFYLCHLFVRERPLGAAGPALVLHLIDLQRVLRARGGRLRQRWIVKDLAALDYSAPAGVVTRADKVRFLRGYLQVRKLDASARELVRLVAAKSSRIARHDAKLRARGTS